MTLFDTLAEENDKELRNRCRHLNCTNDVVTPLSNLYLRSTETASAAVSSPPSTFTPIDVVLPTSPPAFDRLAFWPTLRRAVADLSRQCTVLALAFDRPPLPDAPAAARLCARLKQLLLVATVSTLNVTAAETPPPATTGDGDDSAQVAPPLTTHLGSLCSAKLFSCLLDIATAVKNLITAAQISTGEKQLLITTGTVWQQCEESFAGLPQTNAEAFARCCRETVVLLDDAWRELKATAVDIRLRDTLASSLALIRSSRAALKKTAEIVIQKAPVLNSYSAIRQLDQLGQPVAAFSETVDDLAVAFYQLEDEEDEINGEISLNPVDRLEDLKAEATKTPSTDYRVLGDVFSVAVVFG